ncbi:helix-turn-helix domain-containing protein [Dactylosporangium vinaceum]|uniref:Helix-turn-helix domain-containing protein n=1 Tax=Dactylosporangium vinaceum TaxID=53362 RepID=A0ABV5MQS7_9ACTN|nr:helix-turn-helix transcriptional regulator [Dactylosporangium vinaceum]UAB96656.1 helix-turn-helix domain-containing protein [Dactylosporangium vinaceum]
MSEAGFAALLRACRARSGLSQELLAARAELSVRNLRDLERGRVTRPRRDTLIRLANALGLSGDDRAAFLRPVLATPGPVDRPAQLPAASRVFVGRRPELGRLDALAAEASALVCVTGLGGVGKSALVLHWARRVQQRFVNGVLYADLCGFGERAAARPSAVLTAFLQALGVREGELPHGIDALAAAYRSAVADRPIAVLLDNARDAEQVRPLLPGGAATVVVTSRDRLPELTALYDAAAIRLEPLPTGDAVALLDATIGPRPDTDRRSIERIAVRCGRLPLALRIAAAKLCQPGGPTVRELAARLEGSGRLDVLRIGNDPRLALRPVFDASYRALDPPAQRLLLWLARHQGPRALAGPAGGSAEGDLLDQLLQAHLVEARDGGFALPDLLREYADELASPARAA